MVIEPLGMSNLFTCFRLDLRFSYVTSTFVFTKSPHVFAFPAVPAAAALAWANAGRRLAMFSGQPAIRVVAPDRVSNEGAVAPQRLMCQGSNSSTTYFSL